MIYVLIFRYFGPSLLLLALLYDYKLQYISPARQQRQHKKISKFRYFVVFLAGILGIGASLIGEWQTGKENRANVQYRQEQEARELGFSNQVVQLQAQLKDVETKYDRILTILATNSAPNPALLSALAQAREQFRIIDAGILDLESWKSDLTQQLDTIRNLQERSAIIEEEKIFIAPSIPMWDYAVKSFIAKLSGIAQQAGLSFSTDFTSLPSLDELCTLPIDKPYGTICFHVATISVGQDLSWTCTIGRQNDMLGIQAREFPKLLFDHSSADGAHYMELSLKQTDLFLPKQPQITEPMPATNYEPVVDRFLRLYIAAEASALKGSAP